MTWQKRHFAGWCKDVYQNHVLIATYVIKKIHCVDVWWFTCVVIWCITLRWTISRRNWNWLVGYMNSRVHLRDNETGDFRWLRWYHVNLYPLVINASWQSLLVLSKQRKWIHKTTMLQLNTLERLSLQVLINSVGCTYLHMQLINRVFIPKHARGLYEKNRSNVSTMLWRKALPASATCESACPFAQHLASVFDSCIISKLATSTMTVCHPVLICWQGDVSHENHDAYFVPFINGSMFVKYSIRKRTTDSWDSHERRYFWFGSDSVIWLPFNTREGNSSTTDNNDSFLATCNIVPAYR